MKNTFLININTKKIINILIFFVFIILVLFATQNVKAQGIQYLNVNKDNFAFNLIKNAVTNKEYIVGDNGGMLVVYIQDTNTYPDITKRFTQQKDYYNVDNNGNYLKKPGLETFDCGSHIDTIEHTFDDPKDNNTTYTLYEDDKGTCSDNAYHINGINVKIPSQSEIENLINKLTEINWGNEPKGCQPYYKGTPKNGDQVDDKGTNYKCPNLTVGGTSGDNGIVVDGVMTAGKYDKDGKPVSQTAQEQAAAAAKSSLSAAAKAATPTIDCAKTPDDPSCKKVDAQSCTDVAGVFGWLWCTLGGYVDDFGTWFEGILYNLLRMPELVMGSDVYNQWGIFRTVATSLLVLVALVAIASQIFNFEFISAYTMRKIIPRLLIATILIFLSFYLISLTIMLVNALGSGVSNLLMGPFANGELARQSESGEAFQYIVKQMQEVQSGQATVATGITLVVATTAFIANGGVGVLIMAIFIVGFAILTAFVTLVIRKILIIGLVMIAPLAIVAWVLPGTEKWFKSWWGLFSKLLFMYPLVMGLIALGRVGAYLIATSTTTLFPAAIGWNFAKSNISGGLSVIMITIAYFAPYYFIPAMFKTAGGAFSKISDGLNSKGKQWGKSSGDLVGKTTGTILAKGAAKGGKGRLAGRAVNKENKRRFENGEARMTDEEESKFRKARSQRFRRGISYAYQGAIIPERIFGVSVGSSLRAKAVAKNDKIVQEEKQEIETLIDVKLRGLDETQVIAELKKLASDKNQDIAHAALAQMQKRNLNSELGELFEEDEQARKHIISKQRTDESYNAYVKEKHKDLHESGWNSDGSINIPKWQENIRGMRQSDVLALHGSAMKRMEAGLQLANDPNAAATRAATRLSANDVAGSNLNVALDHIANSLSTYNAAEDRTKHAIDTVRNPMIPDPAGGPPINRRQSGT